MSSSRYSSHASRSSDNKAECQRLLSDFRVNELKELLRKMSQSQRGRKAELFQRANEILRHGSPKIQIHIHEIHQKCYDSRHTPYRTNHRSAQMKNNHMPSVIQSPNNGQGYVVHPDVKFKGHPFFNKMESIIRPTALVSTAMTPSGSFSMRLQFHLTPRQVQHIYKSKNTQGDYLNQIIIRFARQETSCEQEDFYPKQCYIKVNDNYVPIPGYIPQYSHRPDYKRNGKPVNITNYIKTSAAQTNDIVLYWGHDVMYPQGFCVAIEHVESLSSSDLLTKLKSKGVRSPDMSRALVREKLAVDRDSEISATSLRISLICPLGKLRMTNPCRSMNCSHLQCFDANIYLQMNERKPQWICPVCDKPAVFSDLFVDGFFKEICENSPSNDIEFKADGSWQPFSDKINSHSILTPDCNRAEKGATICINSTPSNSAGGTSADPILIDLTLSDSEDEEPIRTSQSSRKSSTSSISSSTTSNSSTDFYDQIERDSLTHLSPSSQFTTNSDVSHLASQPSSTRHISRTDQSPNVSIGQEESCTVSVITQGSSHPSVITSRSTHPPVISQGSPRHDVITEEPPVHHQDLYDNTYSSDPLLTTFPIDDNLFSLLNFNFCQSDSSFID